MRKVSTAGDRDYVRKRLPIVMTRLEMGMPTIWNTIVIHIFVFHTIQIIEAAGPFCEINMLDIERYHTLFKSLARGTNVMASIKNHYEILEACNQNRLTEDIAWTSDALRSTPAGLAAKPDSAFKTDRCVSALGASTKGKLSPSDLLQIQDLWAIENKGYDAFRDRFARFNRGRGRHRKVSTIAEWQSPRHVGFTADEKLWQTMSSDITVLQCLCLYLSAMSVCRCMPLSLSVSLFSYDCSYIRTQYSNRMIIQRVYYRTTSVLSMEATTSGRRSHRRSSSTTTPTFASIIWRLWGVPNHGCEVRSPRSRPSLSTRCTRGGLPSWLCKATG